MKHFRGDFEFSESINKMATEKVSMYNPTDDTIIEINLSPEDAIRAHKDVAFATTLLNAFLQDQERQSSSVVASEEQENFQATEDTIENNTNIDFDNHDGGNFYRWTTSCVLLLLQAYKENEAKFTNGKQSQKKSWEEVSKILRSNGHDVTGPMCASKLRSLKKTYKAVKDHNNKSGNDRRSWQFFEIMDEIFSKKAWCTPVATASSSGLSKVSIEDESSVSTDLSNLSDSGCIIELSKSKNGCNTLLAKRLMQKEDFEEAKAKRHKERMEMDNKFLAVLEKLANK